MRAMVAIVLIAFAAAAVRAAEKAEPPKGFVPIFDGKTFRGWEGNLKAFRI